MSAYRKVLVVEDDALIRMASCEMVEEIGLETAEAGDGAEALALLRSDPAINVLLTDLGLPGMSGQALIAEALRLKPNLKIIAATGRTAHEAGLPPGALLLMKPYDLNQLRSALA